MQPTLTSPAGDAVPTVPAKVVSVVLRCAAIVLLAAFFLPWGQVWVAGSSCSSRAESNTVGTVSGWEIAMGDELTVLPRQRVLDSKLHSTSRDVRLSAQPVAFIVPIMALVFFALPWVATAGLIPRRSTYEVALPGSILAGLVFLHVTSSLSIPREQQWLIGRTDQSDVYPALELAAGDGWLMTLLALTVIGISGIAGWIIERRAERRQARARREASTLVPPISSDVQGSPS